jgi:hypothetical protein
VQVVFFSLLFPMGYIQKSPKDDTTVPLSTWCSNKNGSL